MCSFCVETLNRKGKQPDIDVRSHDFFCVLCITTGDRDGIVDYRYFDHTREVGMSFGNAYTTGALLPADADRGEGDD